VCHKLKHVSAVEKNSVKNKQYSWYKQILGVQINRFLNTKFLMLNTFKTFFELEQGSQTQKRTCGPHNEKNISASRKEGKNYLTITLKLQFQL